MDYIKLKDYCKTTGVTAINNSINTSVKGYPFVTLLRGNEADNIWFSKNASARVAKGDNFKAIASELYVVETANADGEVRMKLSFNNSSYSDLADFF